MLRSALESFQILLQIGAGTGLIFILRWFWWRLKAASEISAMVISFVVAIYFRVVHPYTNLPAISGWEQIIIGVAITMVGWLLITFLTRPTDHEKLVEFINKTRPGGLGWKRIADKAKAEGKLKFNADETWSVPQGIICMLLGCVALYGILLATGYWMYGNWWIASVLTLLAVISGCLLPPAWKKLDRIRSL